MKIRSSREERLGRVAVPSLSLALTTFAAWRPARVLFGAYLFGCVTMLQFHLQGMEVNVPLQFLTLLPYLASIVVLGADFAQSALDTHQYAQSHRQTVLPGSLSSRRQNGGVRPRLRFFDS